MATKTGWHIIKVEKNIIETSEDGRISNEVLVWAAGNKQILLVDCLPLLKSDHLLQILSDFQLHVCGSDSSLIDSHYALGDAVDVKGGELPPTACQRAKQLARDFKLGSQETLRVQLNSER